MVRLKGFGRIALVLSIAFAAPRIFAQTPPQPPQISAVLNAAGFGGLAPGVIFWVAGSRSLGAPPAPLTDGTTAAAAGAPLPTRLAGARVLVNGVAAPLFYASPQQINAQFPVELTGITSADIQVEVQSAGATVTSNTFTTGVAPYSPGIFVLNPPQPFSCCVYNAPGAILRASDSSRICPQGLNVCTPNPAIPGETVWIYLTGLGAVNGSWSSGQAAQAASPTATTPVVTIGGLPAKVLFSGLAPGFVGLYQVNVIIPPGALPLDNVPLTVSTGGKLSNQVTISIGAAGGFPNLLGGGPPSAVGTSIVVDPRNRATVYAATNSGVFKSTNGGQSWTAANRGLTNLGVQVLAIDPVNTSTIYAGTGGSGVFKSTDAGASWAAVNKGLAGGAPGNPGAGTTVRTLVIDPRNPANLYVGTPGVAGGPIVFKSSDGGATWTDTGLTTPYGYYYPALAVDPSNPSTIYAGLAFGASKSTNGGASWTAINNGLQPQPPGCPTPCNISTPAAVSALVVDPSNPAIVYAASNNSSQGGIFKSTDGGANWTFLSNPDNSGMQALALDPHNSATLYAQAYQGVLKSTDGGVSWNPFYSFPLAFDPQDANTLYGNGNDGIVKTADGGASWAWKSNGISNASVSLLAVDPRNPASVYVVNSVSRPSPNGLFSIVSKSANGGTSWSRLNVAPTDPSPVNAIIIAGVNPATLYAATQAGVFKSTDGGATWSAASNGLPAAPVSSLAVAPSNPAILYAATPYGPPPPEGGQGAPPGFFKSTDGGANWTALANTGLPKCCVSHLALDPSSTAIIYVGVGGASNNDGVYKSTDGGTTWTGVWNGPSHGIRNLFISPSNPAVLFAESNSGLAARSADGGANWTPLSIGLVSGAPSTLAVDPTNAAVMYVGTDGNGVFKSSDGGATWTATSAGLTDLNINALAIGTAANATTLYAGTSGAGVFKSTDGGATWQPTGVSQ